MKLVAQHPHRNACQQACVAMVCDVTMEQVVAFAGDGRLAYDEKIAALGHFGIDFEDIGLRVALYGDNGDFKNIGQLVRTHETLWCSVFSVKDSNYGHAVLIHKGDMYDPWSGLNPVWPWHRMIGFVSPIERKK